MSEHEEAYILSLGSFLDKKQRALWRNIERDIFGDDPNYIPSFGARREEEDKEFFLLYREGEVIGRAAAAIDKKWIAKAKENLGFIDDFVINPQHKHLADMLIEHCLSLLKGKGVEKVIVTSHHFPGLAAQAFEQPPPYGLPCNPPWYIELFEKKGFVKYKEWGNFHFILPKAIPEDSIIRAKKSVTSLQAEVRPLNMRSRHQIKEYCNATEDTLRESFGYSGARFIPRPTSFIKHVLLAIVCWLLKVRIYMARYKSGKIFGFLSFCPDYHVALKPLAKSLGSFNPLTIPRLLISLRRTKRAMIIAIGLREEMRGSGLVNLNLMDYGLKLIKDEGYVELDTGSILMENRVVVKMVKNVQKKYGMNMKHTKYYTLLYTF